MLRTNVLGYSIFNCLSLLLCVRWLLFLLLWIWWIYLDLSVREMRRVEHFSISFAILPRLGSNTKREKKRMLLMLLRSTAVRNYIIVIIISFYSLFILFSLFNIPHNFFVLDLE